MLWQILKKDTRLLWWLVAIMFALRLMQGVLAWNNGIFEGDGRQIEVILENVVGSFSAAILIVMAVHQDGLVGSTQDWLTRPLDRRLLLATKLLFAVTLVLVPYIFLKLTTGVFHGFSLSDTFGGAIITTLLAFVFLVLPAMMLGAVTRNLVQALGIGIAALLIGVFALLLAKHFGVAIVFDQKQFQWQADVLQAPVIMLGAAVVLWLSYARRNTLWARIGCGVTFAACLAIYLVIPFRAVFALQQAVAPNPRAADTIRITYDPSLPPSRFLATQDGFVAKDAKDPAIPSIVLRRLGIAGGRRWAGRHLPIRVTGLPADAVVRVDYLGLKLVAADGRVLYRTAEKNRFITWLLNQDEGSSFKLHHPGPGLGERAIHQQFSIPPDVYPSLKDVPLHVEVDYALTVLGRRSTAVVPVLFSRRPVAGLGICASRIGGFNDRMAEMWCYRETDNARCSLVDLMDTATGKRNPLNDQCTNPDYQPRFLAVAEKLTPSTPAIYVNFPYGLDTKRFPVGFEAISTSQITIRGYTPQAHVWRHLKTPLLRLRDL